MTRTKGRTSRPWGTHWCGGLLYKVGRYSVQCKKCQHIRILTDAELRRGAIIREGGKQ